MSASGARCPDCNVCFRVTAAQLCAAGGLVRCGFCLTVFDAGAQHLPAVAAPVEADRAPNPVVEQSPVSSPDTGSTVAAPTATPQEPATDAPPQRSRAEGERPAPDAEPDTEPLAVAESAAAEIRAGLQPAMAEPESALMPPPDLEVASPAEPEPEVREWVPEGGAGPAPESAAVPQPEGAFTPAAEVGLGVADHESRPHDPEPADSPAAVESGSVQGHGSESGAADPLAVPPWRQPAGAASGGKRAAALVASAGLGALLVQGLYFHADVLDARPELQGIYRVLCGMAPCQRPPYRDLAAIAVDQLVVRASGSGTLRLDAMLTNRGRAAQPLPSVRLGFENLQGAPVAARRFTPGEYLDGSPPAALAAGQSLHLVLELVDPGADAVSYALVPVD